LHTALRRGKFGAGEKRTLTRGLSRPIHIKDDEAMALAISEATQVLV